MGERLSGDGAPVRHRQVHPGGTRSGPSGAQDAAALETVLGAALRTDRLDPEAEQRALTAFRAAGHRAGARRARTRRRDDWRPREERRLRRPVRMTFGVVFASLALGGVAVAAIEHAGSPGHGAGTATKAAHRPAVAAGRPDGTASPSSSGGPGPTGRPSPAQDTEAHCRAYEQVAGRGKALASTAWQQLVTAAGGEDKVAAYCSRQLARATAKPEKPAGTGAPGRRAANSTSGNTARKPGDPGGGTSGGGTGADPGGTHATTGSGSGRTSEGAAPNSTGTGGKSSGRHR
ncbi:hypothetical protein [Streptomyces sp. NBC_00557]|uniref:hypothetical protein n=1 Tax=Streptomyces sp. NBC_00557 TaxID=2975776 RepID=UPI002E805EC7|nr:hypothetical protein [Streptomyces sp. NBC_00557]WUC36319.1 hypothetical protein OG956_19910 [Streptomyces sp. NBC_00557]